MLYSIPILCSIQSYFSGANLVSMHFPKTYFMNIVGVVAWVTIYASLMLNGIYKTTDASAANSIILSLTIFHAVLVGILSLTAYVIKTENKLRLNLLAEALNCSLLLLVFMQFLYVYKYFSNPLYTFSDDAFALISFSVLLEFILFVAPSIANIKALAGMKLDSSIIE